MRITIEVSTKDRTVKAIRRLAIIQLKKELKRRTTPCEQCRTPFIPEKRKKKRFCKDLCRYQNKNERVKKLKEGTYE